ncbi:MAG: hypothetical protein R2797_09820 [Gelidibacter sp.]
MRLFYVLLLALVMFNCSKDKNDDDQPQPTEGTAVLEITELEPTRLETNATSSLRLSQQCVVVKLQSIEMITIGSHQAQLTLELGGISYDTPGSYSYAGGTINDAVDGFVIIDGEVYDALQIQYNFTSVSDTYEGDFGSDESVVGRRLTGNVIYILGNSADEYITVTVRLTNFLVDPTSVGC